MLSLYKSHNKCINRSELRLQNMKTLSITLTLTNIAQTYSQSPDLFGSDKLPKSPNCPPGQLCPQVRHMSNTRNMVFELAEETDNPLGVFTQDQTMPGGLVYPRFLLRRHGCWCNYDGCDGQAGCTQGIAPRVSDYWGMPHKTELDRNCHKMFNAHKCIVREIPGCTDMRTKYKYRFNSSGNGSIECREDKNNDCEQALCLIDKEFAENLVNMARDDPEEVKSWPTEYWYDEDADFEANCPRKQRTRNVVDGGECCGLHLERSYYKSIPTMSECCAEQNGSGDIVSETVRPIGLCV